MLHWHNKSWSKEKICFIAQARVSVWTSYLGVTSDTWVLTLIISLNTKNKEEQRCILTHHEGVWCVCGGTSPFILTSALDKDEWRASRYQLLYLRGRNPRYDVDGKLGPWAGLDGLKKRKLIFLAGNWKMISRFSKKIKWANAIRYRFGYALRNEASP